MKNLLSKSFLALIFFTIITTFFVVLKWPDKNVYIVFCDVGQGDATLIYHGFFQILIDSGVDDRVLKCLSKNMPFWDRTIELVIATHYDNDHIGGFQYVFDAYAVREILTLPFKDDSEDFFAFESKIIEVTSKGTELLKPFLGQKIRFSSGEILTVVSSLASLTENLPGYSSFLLDVNEKNYLLEKTSDSMQVKNWLIDDENNQNTESILSDLFFTEINKEADKNNLSIVLLFEYKNAKLLLTGDLGEEQEKALLASGLITGVNLLKVGHHGSNSSSSSQFLESLQPEVAIVSSGKNNSYGHPDQNVLNRISDLGAKIFRTDERGDLKFASNGDFYWLAN